VSGLIETRELIAPEGAILECDIRMNCEAERAVDAPAG
jgi:hypothetical protein